MIAPDPGAAPSADMDLATRDSSLPGLKFVLSDDQLSAAMGERVHIIRVRYKPRTSALVAFRRSRGDVDEGGVGEYGWAMTRAPEGNEKLSSRASSDNGGERTALLRPDPSQPDTVIAVGDLINDWPLRKNLNWLRSHGLERIHFDHHASPSLPVSVSILRYNPGRRVVALFPSRRPVVIKTAARPYDHAHRAHLNQHMHRAGVPVLPELGHIRHARHGISAAPEWGNGDLSATGSAEAAHRAGRALAALHTAETRLIDGTGIAGRIMARQLINTRRMIAMLLPELEEPAARLADRILARLARPDRFAVPVLVHGDFSADQILVRGAEVRFIDFDRIRIDESAADLGSFAAAEEILSRDTTGNAGNAKTAALIHGYRCSGGRVAQERIDAWAAARLFTGSVDPFRNRSANWAADTYWHLERAKELTS